MKTLKPGPRPFIAFGIICGLMYLCPLYLGIETGKWADAGKMAGCLLILPVLLLSSIVFFRIEIDQTEIRIKNFGRIRKRMDFKDIEQSFVNVLAEKEWPVSVTMLGKDRNSELMSIGLKVLRKEDVEWLLSLPQLKLKRKKS